MKKLLQIASLSLVMLIGTLMPAAAALAETWDVQMQGLPEETTSKTLHITYSVISKDKSDDKFVVHLVQNGETVATDTITVPGGDSKTFKVTVPSAGTYTFAVTADNVNAGKTKNSQIETIKVEEPVTAEPTVSTVFVTRTAADGDGTGNGAAGGSGGGTDAGGRVLAQGTNAETVSDDVRAQAANGDANGETTEVAQTAEPDSLGQGSTDATEDQSDNQAAAETTVEAGDNDGLQIAIILALLAAAVGYGAYRYNPSSKK